MNLQDSATSTLSSPPLRLRKAGSRRPRLDTGVYLTCTFAVLCTAWWALAAPLGPMPATKSNEAVSSLAPVEPRASGGDPSKSGQTFNLEAFRNPVWVAPPTPPVPPPPPPPPATEPIPPTLKWQLLAISHSGLGAQSSRAVVYDPESDSVLELALGQSHQGRDIERIENGVVTIKQGKHSYTLSLERPTSGSGPGGEK